MSSTQTRAGKFARLYAEQGITVFPVQSGGKDPHFQLLKQIGDSNSWQEEATSDPERVRQWWEADPHANVGIATGDWKDDAVLFVVDIDVKNGKDGRPTWRDLCQSHSEPIPDTLTISTPSGGFHLYFRAPPGVTIKSAEDNLGDGVDTKGHGGYVVAPPSSTETGAYAIKEKNGGIAQAPFWLLSEAKKSVQSDSGPDLNPASTNNAPAANEIESALGAIPPNPPYWKWMEIIAAVKDGTDSIGEAERMLEAWSPENQSGDYTYGERLRNAPDEQYTVKTLFRYAYDAGWDGPERNHSPSAPHHGDGEASSLPEPPHPAEMGIPEPTGHEDEVQTGEPSLDDFDILSTPDLLNKELEPLRPLVTYEDRTVLPEGITLLAAKPKIGKSFLAMNTAFGIASGGRVMSGGIVHEAHEGSVLYLNLDGSMRGAKQRFEQMIEQTGDAPPERLHLLHGAFPTVDEGALDVLEEWLERKPDTSLIVVDTLQHLRPTTDGRRNQYHSDYDFLFPIAEVGRRHDVSILLVHHLNKLQNGDELDKVSGSTGLTGAVENVLVLNRARGEQIATLAVRPREEPEEEFTLKFDTRILTWCLGAEAEDDGPRPSTPERQEVWDVLKNAESEMELTAIAEAVGKSKSAVSNLLARLHTDDNMPVKKPRSGVYRASP